MSIKQGLLKFDETVKNAVGSVQKYLEDRTGGLKKWADGILTKNDFVNENAKETFSSLIDQYKVRVDPRLVPPKTFDPNFDGVGARTIIQNNDFFTQLGTMDLWNATVQAKSLNGLIGSKNPLLPMIFGIQLPPSSTEQPPGNLTLFVNPSGWSRSISKVQQNQWTRRGVKTERWGEDMEQIQAQGEIGGFFTMQTGLTRYHRWQTPTFRNLMELVQIYRNNGCTYGKSYSNNSDFVAPSNNRILDVGYIEILYGYEVFIGNFEQFEITEEDEKPHTLSYTFVFNCANVVSIHDLNPSTSQQLSQPRQSGSVTLVPGYTVRADYNDNVTQEVTALEAAMKAAGESPVETKNSTFTIPNKTVSEAPKDTLFPTLLSEIGKQDPTRAFVYNTDNSKNSRNALKLDFRDAAESDQFHQNLPQDPTARAAYIQDFLAKQKVRSGG